VEVPVSWAVSRRADWQSAKRQVGNLRYVMAQLLVDVRG
jgi:hypothetical protein